LFRTWFENHQNTVYIENTAAIKYSGKGADVSFALMGAMGPMGAAIGVAIDEGILQHMDLLLHIWRKFKLWIA
jgi:hypothetical protein